VNGHNQVLTLWTVHINPAIITHAHPRVCTLSIHTWWQQASYNKQQRLASKTGEERAARREQSRSRQQETGVAKTDAERSNELQQDQDYHWHHWAIDYQSSLVHQPAVHSKIARFHSHPVTLCSFQAWYLSEGVSKLFLPITERQISEMLIAAVVPILYIYRLPQGQYGYSGMLSSCPRMWHHLLIWLSSKLDILIVRAQCVNHSHQDVGACRAVVDPAVRWLVTHNMYYSANHVSINQSACARLPQDDNLSTLASVVLDSPEEWSSSTTWPWPLQVSSCTVICTCCYPFNDRASGCQTFSSAVGLQPTCAYLIYNNHVAIHQRNSHNEFMVWRLLFLCLPHSLPHWCSWRKRRIAASSNQ